MNDFPQTQGGCWPTRTQELLLRASLTQGEEALLAWREWQKHTDIENLDFSSHLLLPLLLRNLEAQGIENSLLLRYKSVSRHTWVQNQFLLKQAQHIVRLLESEGIPSLVLKGAALASLYYPDVSMRPMNDVDILVPTREASRAFQFMQSQGYQLQHWENSPARPEDAFSVVQAYSFHKGRGEEFRLHQHVFSQSFAPGADGDFWGAAVPLEIGDASTRALCAEDALLHVCTQRARWSTTPPLRWIADATMILRGTPDFNWNRLVEQTRRHRLSIPMREALHYLHNAKLNVPIPALALRELDGIAVSRAERREWSALARPTRSHSIALKLWLRSRAYSRWNQTNPLWQRPFTFPRYMQSFWGLKSLSELPSHGLKRFLHHLRKR